jgi:hypothetical protein
MYDSIRTGFGRRVRLAGGLAITVVMLGACATTPTAPPDSLAAARQAIANAEKSDARKFASAELDEANQRLARAERAVTADNMVQADRLAQESRVSAVLASARTETAKAVEINREMSLGAEALRVEMQRTGDLQ